MSEASGQTLEQLQILAKRLRTNQGYMAWVLGRYQKQERLSDIQLEERLEISPGMHARLAICKRPDTNSPDFGKQVTQIAQFVSLDPTRLASLVRQVESLAAFEKVPEPTDSEAQAHSPNAGLFAAARDRADQVEESPESSENQETGGDDEAG